MSKVKELTFGEFNFTSMNKEALVEVLSVLVKGFDPELDSVARMRVDAHAVCKRLGLKNMDDVLQHAENERKEKLKDCAADVVALLDNRGELESLLKKSGARVQWEKYSDPEDNHRLVAILDKRLKEQHGGISVAELRALEIPSGGEGRGIPIEFDDLESVPTVAPNGVSEEALAWFTEEFQRAASRNEAAPKIGRNEGKHAMAQVLRSSGERLYMSLPQDYALKKSKSKSQTTSS